MPFVREKHTFFSALCLTRTSRFFGGAEVHKGFTLYIIIRLFSRYESRLFFKIRDEAVFREKEPLFEVKFLYF